MSSSNSQRGVDRWYVVGAVAAVIAVIECGIGVVLVNNAAVIDGFALAGWVPPAMTVGLIAVAIVVAGAAALSAVPRPHYLTV
ncbi:hypothetical protein LQ757_12165 [Agromyces sp. SYSU K20354]|uniref:hypothetical protein n=1 Tax=Agromyces cavernae TaxID=2898659 RepID=UPI001E51F5A1|nr:hypothetical protein [Agromyces cavernae]MCD2443028.1 hypothetical protein [Agromyces cavernae]